MKVVIFGIGRMGMVIAHAMKRLEYTVVGVDSSSEARQNLNSVIEGQDFVFYQSNNLDADRSEILKHEEPDIVISSMPYHQNWPLARYCILNEIRYCDLGGSVPVSKQINELGNEKATKPIMTDLGLAPGWVNILTEWGYKKLHGAPDRISMMVGGLPETEVNHPLDYVVTWSIDGLINEYKDDCEILENGEIIRVKGMDGHEKVYIDHLGKELEAFYTSGGASHTIEDMKRRGVKNCDYKTIRYAGHRDIIKFLIRDCGLSNETLSEIFLKGCSNKASVKDMVILKSIVEKDSLKWHKEIVIPADEKFSAMQRATAFPISAVASLMAEGIFDERYSEHRDYKDRLPLALSYKDIPKQEFNKKIGMLGLGIK
jgi:saccharopine dehydrogenase-like NADP-dependent oxidoreductase